MKTAIVCFYEAYPPISGAAAVSFNLARFLPGNKLLIQVGAQPNAIKVAGTAIVTIAGRPVRPVCKLAAAMRVIGEMVREVVRYRADTAILEGASWAMYHWLLLSAIRRVAPELPVVYHSHNVEYLLRRKIHNRAVAAITRWAERRLVTRSDLATAVSEVDRSQFRTLYGADVSVLPNGVDAARFESVTNAEVDRTRAKYNIGKEAIIFNGLYAYPPNRVAIDFLLSRAMPVILARAPNAQLVVSGADLPRQPWLVSPGVVPYDDLPALIASCAVAAAPIFSGSGTRLKILEAMAAGVPVVATPKGAEGLPFRHGEHLLLAQRPEIFTEYLLKAIGDSTHLRPMAGRALEAVRDRFDWPAIVARTALPMSRASAAAVAAEVGGRRNVSRD